MFTVVLADVVEIALNDCEIVCHLHKLNSTRCGGMHPPGNAAHSIAGLGLEIPTDRTERTGPFIERILAINVRREFAKPCQLHARFPDARWRAFLRFRPKL